MSELFVEVGTEELPAGSVLSAVQALAAGLVKLLGPIRHGQVRTFATPRRLAVAIANVERARPTVERLVTGPPVAQAFRDGAPGPVAEAFAKARGVNVGELLTVDGPKGPVIAVRRLEGGEATEEIVAKGLEEVVLAIPFKKSMRWTESRRTFARPIHSLCVLFGGQVVETSVVGVLSSGRSHGHWLYAGEGFDVTSADQYVAELRERWVLADVHERRTAVLEQLGRAAAQLETDAVFDTELVDEVVQLVEWPKTLIGHFHPSLLELPPRLLVESMKKNQRYFPVYRDGQLTDAFFVVSNNPFGDDDLIAAGNARVLAARFSDAHFFYAEDRKKPLAVHGERLAGMTWIRGLGTMADRQAALAEAAAGVATLLGADPFAARRAGSLCKSDLTTQMVGEFPELQGHVGRLLAHLDGEADDVALAIEESYLPRFAGDALPTSGPGRALALAERLTLLGRAFARGHAPKGSADPLGLRRAANGVVTLVLAANWRGPLSQLFAAANEPDADVAVYEFVLARLRASLAEEAAVDVVDAVLAAPRGQTPGEVDLALAAERVRGLEALVRSGAFTPIRLAFRRAAGLVKEHRDTSYDVTLLGGEAGIALHEALLALPVSADTASQLAALSALRPHVDRYFDAVLVMCDDVDSRSSRLGLLRSIVERFAGLADFTRLSGE